MWRNRKGYGRYSQQISSSREGQCRWDWHAWLIPRKPASLKDLWLRQEGTPPAQTRILLVAMLLTPWLRSLSEALVNHRLEIG